MKIECSIIKDLLPLYAENMVSEETAKHIEEHLRECPQCQAELEGLREGAELIPPEKAPQKSPDSVKPFKKMMKRMNKQFYMLAYSLIIFFIFLGFAWTAGENLMYNSLLMPVVGIFGYYVFRWRAVYKMPILLLSMNLFVCLFKLAEIDLYSAFLWTGIYSIFVFIGIAIAFLLHFALRKENKK